MIPCLCHKCSSDHEKLVENLQRRIDSLQEVKDRCLCKICAASRTAEDAQNVIEDLKRQLEKLRQFKTVTVTMPMKKQDLANAATLREQANAIGQDPLCEQSYQFTTDQLYTLLVETIDLRDEIRDKHGYESSSARHQAAYETIDGLNEERYLHSIGEGSLKLSQMIAQQIKNEADAAARVEPTKEEE